MRAGELKARITFQRLDPTTDAEWGRSEEWTEFATVWASVLQVGGAETAKEKGVQTTQRYQIRIRHLAGVSSENQIRWRDKTLDIVSITDPDNRRRELLIEAAEHPQQEQ